MLNLFHHLSYSFFVFILTLTLSIILITKDPETSPSYEASMTEKVQEDGFNKRHGIKPGSKAF